MAVIAAGVLYRIVALRVARAGERAVDLGPVVSGGKKCSCPGRSSQGLC